MDLREIEAKADELLEQMYRKTTGPAGVAEMRDICTRMDVLERAARIKSTVAFRKEQEADRLQPLMYGGSLLGQKEPTKPAIDRLHEMVSYLHEQSRENHGRADRMPDGDKAARYLEAAGAYDDAALKLREILRGGCCEQVRTR